MIAGIQHRLTLVNALIAALALAACGGGDGGMRPGPAVLEASAAHGTDSDESGSAAVSTTGDESRSVAALAYIGQSTSLMKDLSFAASSGDATLAHIGATAGCAETFIPPASLTKTTATALPPKGGIFFTPAQLDTWRGRTINGPFIYRNDFKPGSPDDWNRISANAASLVANGEPLQIVSNPDGRRTTHGTLARDAAFHYLITGDSSSLAAVRSHLLAQAAAPVNDFSTLCFRALDRSTRDAWFGEASWLLRHIVAYDFVRAALSEPDRVVIENWIRRNAYFFAAQIDWGIAYVFPKRLQGDYATRTGPAAATTESGIYTTARVDSNGDCKIDASDDPMSYPVYAYTRADGSKGPRISVLSQYFNNRKSINAAAFGAAGLLLKDYELINRAKRYTMEWLAFGVAADGSEGEYIRNGEYCIPKQGVIYAASNIQSALLMARMLHRFGDRTLVDFKTTDGLFGTESGLGQASKSIELVMSTHHKLLTRQLGWYFHEASRSTQSPREQTHLGKVESQYMGGASSTDNFHELGLLLGAKLIPAVPVSGLVLRDPAVTSLAFPGKSGNPVATGYGSWAGVWTDAFNAMPSLFLIRP